MKFGAKKNPTVLAGGVTFRAKFHSKSLYSVEKKIVGISQYAYFRTKGPYNEETAAAEKHIIFGGILYHIQRQETLDLPYLTLL
jgi:hypothetical protein